MFSQDRSRRLTSRDPTTAASTPQPIVQPAPTPRPPNTLTPPPACFSLHPTPEGRSHTHVLRLHRRRSCCRVPVRVRRHHRVRHRVHPQHSDARRDRPAQHHPLHDGARGAWGPPHGRRLCPRERRAGGVFLLHRTRRGQHGGRVDRGTLRPLPRAAHHRPHRDAVRRP